jgi:hypothetical protein
MMTHRPSSLVHSCAVGELIAEVLRDDPAGDRAVGPTDQDLRPREGFTGDVVGGSRDDALGRVRADAEQGGDDLVGRRGDRVELDVGVLGEACDLRELDGDLGVSQGRVGGGPVCNGLAQRPLPRDVAVAVPLDGLVCGARDGVSVEDLDGGILDHVIGLEVQNHAGHGDGDLLLGVDLLDQPVPFVAGLKANKVPRGGFLDVDQLREHVCSGPAVRATARLGVGVFVSATHGQCGQNT